MRIARRASGRIAADVPVGLPQGIDEAQGRLRPALAQIVLDNLVHIVSDQRAGDDRLDSHPRTRCLSRSRKPALRPSKYSVSAGASGGDAAPANSRSRRRCRSRSRADQLAQVLAIGPVATLANLCIDEGLEVIGQRDVHRAHAWHPNHLAKSWQDRLAHRLAAERDPSNPLCRRSAQSYRTPEVALSCRAAAPVCERAAFERAILIRRRDPAERVGAGRAAASCRPLL